MPAKAANELSAAISRAAHAQQRVRDLIQKGLVSTVGAIMVTVEVA
jgi:hypothetical protein